MDFGPYLFTRNWDGGSARQLGKDKEPPQGPFLFVFAALFVFPGHPSLQIIPSWSPKNNFDSINLRLLGCLGMFSGPEKYLEF